MIENYTGNIEEELEEFKNNNIRYIRFRKRFLEVKALAEGFYRFSKDIFIARKLR